MLGMTKRSRYAKHEDEITECKAWRWDHWMQSMNRVTECKPWRWAVTVERERRDSGVAVVTTLIELKETGLTEEHIFLTLTWPSAPRLTQGRPSHLTYTDNTDTGSIPNLTGKVRVTTRVARAALTAAKMGCVHCPVQCGIRGESCPRQRICCPSYLPMREHHPSLLLKIQCAPPPPKFVLPHPHNRKFHPLVPPPPHHHQVKDSQTACKYVTSPPPTPPPALIFSTRTCNSVFERVALKRRKQTNKKDPPKKIIIKKKIHILPIICTSLSK